MALGDRSTGDRRNWKITVCVGAVHIGISPQWAKEPRLSRVKHLSDVEMAGPRPSSFMKVGKHSWHLRT
jgi:hypothetical protein